MAPKQTLLVIIICLLFISSLTLYPVFNLALFGDDWLTFWRYLHILGPSSDGQYNHLTYFFTHYGSQDILIGQLQNLYGYRSEMYHLTSYLFRILAALSIFPLAFYLTKDKIASLFAVVFISVTTIGFDTTNWVFNMPSYLSIACFSLSLYFYLRSVEKLKLIFPAGLFYFMANILAPIRMSAALPIIIALEIFNFFDRRNPFTIKQLILRITFTLVLTYLVIQAGSFGTTEVWNENITSGISVFGDNLSPQRFDFLVYPIITLGSMLIPDLLFTSNQPIVRKMDLILLQIPLFLAFLGITFIINKYSVYKLSSIFSSVLLTGVLWNLIVYSLHIANLQTLLGKTNLTLLITGGYVLIISFYLFLTNLKKLNFSLSILLSLMLMLLTFAVAWWRSPLTIYETTHRYLIVSSLGMALLLSTIISMGAKKKGKAILLSLCIVVLISQMFATRLYINKLESYHGQNLSNKIWRAFPYYPELEYQDGPFVFYFTSDDQSSTILHNVITFGLPPHMGLIYNRREWNVIPMDDWKELQSAVKDGLVFRKYGAPIKPIPIKHIYAFHLQNKTELIDKTDQIRRKLEIIKGVE